MTKNRWDGDSFEDIALGERWDGSAWVTLTVAERWDGSAWVAIPLAGGGALSATVNDETIYGSEERHGPGQPSVLVVNSDTPSQAIITAIGGTGPYTYLWTHESGDSAVQVIAPTAATTGFTANLGKNQSKTAVKRCRIMDSLSATFYIYVTVTLEYIFEVDG